MQAWGRKTDATAGKLGGSPQLPVFNAGIPFLQLPFQQNKFASNLFMVLSVSKAKACLQRAGFQAKFDSETVLFDGCNGSSEQVSTMPCL
jgi:hypothetical protein